MTCSALPADRCRLVSAALFAFSFLLSLHLLTRNPGVPLGSGFEVVAVAENLAERGAFANPFGSAETGPTAVVPPLYPLLLAGLIRLAGDGVFFAALATVLALLAQALHAALLPHVSRMLFGGILPGVYGALLSILFPAFKLFPAREAIYVATGLMVFCLATGPHAPHQTRLFRRGASNGAAAGLLALLNPITIPVAFAWQTFRIAGKGVDWRRALRFFAGFGIGFLLICAPWTLRNYRQLGGLILIRDNFGLELRVANNSAAESSLVRNLASHRSLHPNLNKHEAELVGRMGELRFMAMRMEDAKRWIRENPRRFTHLTLKRAWEFWFPDAAGMSPYAYSVWLITLLSVPGIYRIGRRQPRLAVFLGAAVVVPSSLYCVVQSDIFYRYPLLWLSMLSGGYWLADAAQPAVLGRLREWIQAKPVALPLHPDDRTRG